MVAGRAQTGVIGVLSAFRAPDDLPARTRGLLEQVDAVVIVDDGTQSLSRLDFDDARIVTIELPENAGIAAALNRGISVAREMKARFVLTLDQDSALPDGYVHAALGRYEELRDAGHRPAAIVPARFGNVDVVSTRDGTHPLDPIQSGQIIPVDLFDEIGVFDERLFIDSVDTEYTMRARGVGRDFWFLPGSTLEHSLGERVPIRLFGKELVFLGKARALYYHAPFRTYYIVRNGLVLRRLHPARDRLWLARRTLAMLWATALTLLLAPDRRAQTIAARHGLRDARRMSLGRIPARTVAAIEARRPKRAG